MNIILVSTLVIIIAIFSVIEGERDKKAKKLLIDLSSRYKEENISAIQKIIDSENMKKDQKDIILLKALTMLKKQKEVESEKQKNGKPDSVSKGILKFFGWIVLLLCAGSIGTFIQYANDPATKLFFTDNDAKCAQQYKWAWNDSYNIFYSGNIQKCVVYSIKTSDIYDPKPKTEVDYFDPVSEVTFKKQTFDFVLPGKDLKSFLKNNFEKLGN